MKRTTRISSRGAWPRLAAVLAATWLSGAAFAQAPPQPMSANCLAPEQQAQYKARVAEVMGTPTPESDAMKAQQQRYREARGKRDQAQAALDQCRKGGGACAAEQQAVADQRAALKAADAERQKVFNEKGAPAAERIRAIRAEYPPCR